MKVGDLVNSTHALDRSTLGLIVAYEHDPTKRSPSCDYRVKWLNPPRGCPPYSWNSEVWLEVVSESR